MDAEKTPFQVAAGKFFESDLYKKMMAEAEARPKLPEFHSDHPENSMEYYMDHARCFFGGCWDRGDNCCDYIFADADTQEFICAVAIEACKFGWYVKIGRILECQRVIKPKRLKVVID